MLLVPWGAAYFIGSQRYGVMESLLRHVLFAKCYGLKSVTSFWENLSTLSEVIRHVDFMDFITFGQKILWEMKKINGVSKF